MPQETPKDLIEEIMTEFKDCFPALYQVMETTDVYGVNIATTFQQFVREKLQQVQKAAYEQGVMDTRIEVGAKDFAERFTPVMKKLSEE